MFTKTDTKQVIFLLGMTALSRFCLGVEENECHLCFKCSMYTDIRPYVMKNVELYQESARLARLMYSRADGTIRKIEWYMFKAFELRKRAVDSMGQ